MTTTITTTPTDETRRHAGAVSKGGKDKPEPEVLERARGPRRYSASYKARILSEYEKLDKAAKGALLRREGLYSSLISEWRKQRERSTATWLGSSASMTIMREPASAWLLSSELLTWKMEFMKCLDGLWALLGSLWVTQVTAWRGRAGDRRDGTRSRS